MSNSPRTVVILNRTATATSILRDIKAFTGYGLSEIRSRIVAGLPVVIEEMFSNAWYDERAQLLLALLTKWQNEGITFEIREVAEDDPIEAGALISMEVLQSLIQTRMNRGTVSSSKRKPPVKHDRGKPSKWASVGTSQTPPNHEER